MDFKSPKGWNAAVGPLSVLDDHSRYLLVLQAVWSTHGDLVREQLETAFARAACREAMLMDHGIPWWSARAPTGATRLTVWLMKQGIRLHWSGFRHPQTQGKVERFHGALERALQARGAPRKEPQPWLDEFRWEHNHVRPHEALGMQTPASVWRKSERSYDPHPPRWEYPTGAQVLKVGRQGNLDAYGRPLEHRQGATRRVGATGAPGATGPGVLLPHPGPRTRPENQRSTAVERWLPDTEAE